MRRSALILAVAATFGLAACEEGAARRDRAASAGDGGLCKPFADLRNQASATNPALGAPMMMDGARVVEDCVHRWGYTLAKSDDDADVVAQAVVAACSAPLARWNQQALSAAAGGDRDGLQEAPSLLTGQTTNPIMEHNNFAEGRALFYVVQARAGDCDAPRAEPRRDDDRDDAAPAAGYAPNSPDR